jgi:hypothetical protein
VSNWSSSSSGSCQKQVTRVAGQVDEDRRGVAAHDARFEAHARRPAAQSVIERAQQLLIGGFPPDPAEIRGSFLQSYPLGWLPPGAAGRRLRAAREPTHPFGMTL